MIEETIILVTIPSLFSLIIILLLDRNWFRRERFKTEMNFVKKKNDLEFKKLAKEYGLSTKTPDVLPEKTRGSNLAAAVLPEIIKNMDPDTLANIATNLIGSYAGGGDETEGGAGDLLLDFINNNPDVVKSFLGGVKSGAQKTGSDKIGQV